MKDDVYYSIYNLSVCRLSQLISYIIFQTCLLVASSVFSGLVIRPFYVSIKAFFADVIAYANQLT
jgi:hypothetical protein